MSNDECRNPKSESMSNDECRKAPHPDPLPRVQGRGEKENCNLVFHEHQYAPLGEINVEAAIILDVKGFCGIAGVVAAEGWGLGVEDFAPAASVSGHGQAVVVEAPFAF